MSEGWKPLNEVLELPVKSTKTSSENSGSSTSIYGIKKKKTSSTKPLVISDKVIGLICTFAFVVGNVVGVAGCREATGMKVDGGGVRLVGFLPGVLIAFVVWILLFIINEILEKLQS